MAKSKGKGFEGGECPTGLSSNNDGFTSVPDRKPSFGHESGTMEVGREETLDITKQGGK